MATETRVRVIALSLIVWLALAMPVHTIARGNGSGNLPQPKPSMKADSDVAAVLNDFTRWKAGQGAVISLVPNPSEANAAGKQAMRIDFTNVNGYPQASIAADSVWDLTDQCVLVHFTCNGDKGVSVGIFADNDLSHQWPKNDRSGGGSADAHQAGIAILTLGPEQDNLGLRLLPAIVPECPYRWPDRTPIDAAKVVRIALTCFLNQGQSASITVTSIETRAVNYSLDGLIDAYGQYSRADWPGKVHGQRDLDDQRKAEAKELKALPGPTDWDRYGGWKAGPTLTATGFFRTQKVDGKWSFVDPDGRLFFSIGMNCVSMTTSTTITSGPRTKLFQWLPAPGDPLGEFVGSVTTTTAREPKQDTTFDFYAANVERKYGRKFLADWKDIAAARLRSWGFNTVGNWSPEMSPNNRVPYVVTIEPVGTHARIKGAYRWEEMHDPFDPQFAVDVVSAIQAKADLVRNDPYCLGYFVDNEPQLGYGGSTYMRLNIPTQTMNMDAATSPAKRAFIADLKAKYGTIDALNAVWKTKLASWDVLSAPYYLEPFDEKDGCVPDYSAFLSRFADQYFRVVHDALRKCDPNHLYLGCRFCGWSYELTDVAAKYCDVMSFTDYDRSMDPKTWSFLTKYDVPCLVDEFSFGAMDRGMFSNGMGTAKDQNDRGVLYKEYIDSAIQLPLWVGAHWFEYVDQPAVGRAIDGECGNYGFLSQADTPYTELVAAARAENADIYAKRYGEH